MEKDDRQIVTKTADRDTDRCGYRQKADSNRDSQWQEAIGRDRQEDSRKGEERRSLGRGARPTECK